MSGSVAHFRRVHFAEGGSGEAMESQISQTTYTRLSRYKPNSVNSEVFIFILGCILIPVVRSVTTFWKLAFGDPSRRRANVIMWTRCDVFFFLHLTIFFATSPAQYGPLLDCRF